MQPLSGYTSDTTPLVITIRRLSPYIAHLEAPSAFIQPLGALPKLWQISVGLSEGQQGPSSVHKVGDWVVSKVAWSW